MKNFGTLGSLEWLIIGIFSYCFHLYSLKRMTSASHEEEKEDDYDEE